MKKIFILSIVLGLSFGYAYGGEIIRITNNNYFDIEPSVNQQGHVFWRQLREENGGGPSYLMYFNGVDVVEISRGSSYTEYKRTEGNVFVYRKDVDDMLCHGEIYLFDGQKEIRITNNDYTESPPSICNGYIVWFGYPGYPNNSNPPAWGSEIFLYKPDQPTAVQMSALKATPANKAVKLNWQTEAEIDNAGFNVWRAEGFQKVNESLIPAEGSPIMGADYDFFDKWVMNGKLYYYLVEDIDTKGISTFHGPVKATPRWLYGVERN